jgi:hypothetical protein
MHKYILEPLAVSSLVEKATLTEHRGTPTRERGAKYGHVIDDVVRVAGTSPTESRRPPV